jgi:predicted RNase H-like nuclease
MTVVGVDGCPGGWVAVTYEGTTFAGARICGTIESVWDRHGEAEAILVDTPIGLREASNEKRPCDDAAREVLGPRSSSVFPPPVRAAAYEDSYADAKAVQEAATEGSLGVQAWHICPKIRELDALLRETVPDARGTVREAHPELCFWALAGERPMEYSKTGQPAAAFWERVDVLEGVDDGILRDLQAGGTGIGGQASTDDLVDAFALAVTASDLTGSLRTLPPADSPDAERDPAGLPMEMVYSKHRTQSAGDGPRQ